MHSRPVKCSAWMWVIVLCWDFHPTCLPYHQITQTPQSCRVSQQTKGRRAAMASGETCLTLNGCDAILNACGYKHTVKLASLRSLEVFAVCQEIQLYSRFEAPDAAAERSLFSCVMWGVPPGPAWPSEVRGKYLMLLTKKNKCVLIIQTFQWLWV